MSRSKLPSRRDLGAPWAFCLTINATSCCFMPGESCRVKRSPMHLKCQRPLSGRICVEPGADSATHLAAWTRALGLTSKNLTDESEVEMYDVDDLLSRLRNDLPEPSEEAWRRAREAISSSTASHQGGTVLLRRPRLGPWKRSYAFAGLGGLATATVVAILAFSAGNSPSVAFAGWQADPSASSNEQVRAAESECRRNATLSSETPTLIDTRGPYTLLVFAGRGGMLCIGGPSLQSANRAPPVVAFGAFLEASVAAAKRVATERGEASPAAGLPAHIADNGISVATTGGVETEAGELSMRVGRVGVAVTAVGLVLADGTHVQATVANGWFAAWWPGGQPASSAEVTTAQGTHKQQLLPAEDYERTQG